MKYSPVYIPAHIMENKKLSIFEKVLYGKIVGLCGKNGYCFASNTWLAENLGKTPNWVSKCISTFIEYELMTRDIIKNTDGSVKQRRLYPFTQEKNPNLAIGIGENCEGGIGEKHNIVTSNSNSNSNKEQGNGKRQTYNGNVKLQDNSEKVTEGVKGETKTLNSNNNNDAALHGGKLPTGPIEHFYSSLIEYWNVEHSTFYSKKPDNIRNVEYWLERHTKEEIKAAVKLFPYHNYWNEITPTVLFRRRNPKQEPVDYIGDILSFKYPQPEAQKVIKWLKEQHD